jgi:hypothetical protein
VLDKTLSTDPQPHRRERKPKSTRTQPQEEPVSVAESPFAGE